MSLIDNMIVSTKLAFAFSCSMFQSVHGLLTEADGSIAFCKNRDAIFSENTVMSGFYTTTKQALWIHCRTLPNCQDVGF